MAVRIVWVAVVEQVGEVDGQPAYVGLGADASLVDEFPCETAGLRLLVDLVAPYAELGATDHAGRPVPHLLRWSVLDPGEQEIGSGVEGPFGLLTPSPWHRDGWDGHLFLTPRVTFAAPREGAYTIRVHADDSEPWDLRHYVVRLGDLL